MVLTGPFASYVELDWSASVEGSGSNYRIVDRTSSDDVLVTSSSATLATIQDLNPGDGAGDGAGAGAITSVPVRPPGAVLPGSPPPPPPPPQAATRESVAQASASARG